jgi:predicted transcriptional regulator
MSNKDMPRRGFDNEKVRKIKRVLVENPQGLWVREIARKSGLDKSTVSIYLSKYMKDDVSVISISGLVKLYKLEVKSGV